MEPTFEEQAADLMDAVIEPTGEIADDESAIEVEPVVEEVVEVVPDKVDDIVIEEPTPIVPEVDTRDTTIEAMRKEISELVAKLNGASPEGKVWPEGAKPEVEVKTEPPAKATPQEDPNQVLAKLLEDIQYLSEDELDKVIDEPHLINQAINKSRKETVQALITALPGIVSGAVNQQIMINQAVTSFYEANGDLIPHADYVRYVMGQVESANPTKTYQEIFNDTAVACRKRLGLNEPGVITPTKDKTKGDPLKTPAFAGNKKGSVTRPTEKKNELFDPNAADLMDM